MKFVTYLSDNNSAHTGIISGSKVIDLYEGARMHGIPCATFNDMISLISNMQISCENAEKVMSNVLTKGNDEVIYDIEKIQLLAPVPRPLSIRDFMVFADHLANSMNTIAGWYFPPARKLNELIRKISGKGFLKPSQLWYKIPAYYKGNPLTVIGHQQDIIWPDYEERLDYELEFGIYLCKHGKNIPASKASEYIAGYTVFNDVSARKTQIEEIRLRLGPAKGKDFDTGNIMGPYLVTPDELKDPYNLNMTARVNGETWSSGNSSNMHYSFEELIEYVSRNETLFPGEFFGSGTVPSGCGLELDKWIKPNDTIELEVEKIGILRNRVILENQVN